MNNNLETSAYVQNAVENFQEVVLEAQKEQPNQKAIDFFTQAAVLHQRVVEMYALALPEKAIYLNHAGYALYKAAKEAQKPKPNQQIIDWLTQAAGLHQEAIVALDSALPKKADYLDRAGSAFHDAAREAQTLNPNQQIIDRFTQAAGLYQQAAEAWNSALPKKAICLSNAGVALQVAAREALRDQPNQEAIDWVTHSARLYQQAAEALEALPEKADYLYNAGISFFRAAEEAQKLEPNQQQIETLLIEARDSESKAARENQSCAIS